MIYGTDSEINILLENEALEVLTELLMSTQPELIKNAIGALNSLMRQFNDEDEFDNIMGNFDSLQGVETMMELTIHPNIDISKAANKFLKSYYYVPESFILINTEVY